MSMTKQITKRQHRMIERGFHFGVYEARGDYKVLSVHRTWEAASKRARRYSDRGVSDLQQAMLGDRWGYGDVIVTA